MARQVFVSILGTGFYQKSIYGSNDYKSEPVRFIQEATLELLKADKWSSSDTALILLTNKARESNWNKDVSERENFRNKEKESYIGLEKCLKDKNYNFTIRDVDIPNGNNEEEIWDIFEILYKNIQEGDELHIDITHSFRYLPMLLIVFCNYVKFLKGAVVKSITYGNYEGRNTETNICPIVDLMPISALQDWTFATASYLNNGSVDSLVELSKSELNPILKEAKGANADANILRKCISSIENMANERTTCRGIKIIESKEVAKLKDAIKELDNVIIEPLKPVITKIEKSIEDFDVTENVENGFKAAKWCFDNKLYQQSLTILFENITTFICIDAGLDWHNIKERETATKAFNVFSEPKEKWKVKDDNQLELILTIHKMDSFKSLQQSYRLLRDIRNDYNHSGMRDNAMKHTDLIKNITKIFDEYSEII